MLFRSTQTGKSSLIEPYIELYENVACYVSEEKGFSFSHISKYPKIIINEFDCQVVGNGMNQMKNLLEGAPFNIVVKNKEQERVCPKNVVMTSNNLFTKRDDFGYVDFELDALKSRLMIFSTFKNCKIINDPSKISLISREASSVCVLCTQSKNYVKLKKKHLNNV